MQHQQSGFRAQGPSRRRPVSIDMVSPQAKPGSYRPQFHNAPSQTSRPSLQPKPVAPQPAAPMQSRRKPVFNPAQYTHQPSQVRHQTHPQPVSHTRPVAAVQQPTTVAPAPKRSFMEMMPKNLPSFPVLPFKTRYAYMGIGVFIAAIGIFASLSGLQNNDQVAAQSKKTGSSTKAQTASNSTQSAPAPDETPLSPSDIQNYKVAADAPRYVTIPKIGVYARIMSLGVSSTGELMPPDSIYDVGWFNGSVKPGESGVMIMGAHKSGTNVPGVLKNANNLAQDDLIGIERGDGTTVTYKVIKVKSYAPGNSDLAEAIQPIDPSKPGLNIITSLSGEGEREVVYASLAD